MRRKDDYTDDLEFIRSIADKDNITAPESLSEDRIMAMLAERSDDLPADPEHMPHL